ncbi:hypothetical protein Pmani_025437 [Petrolisthes manimaculis]|uniref:SRCR domain-containing protein n=1 Tax=Petrolisthes manimaculis TaxID=1843537 RepID=A0AAE1U163_9EUCA|nr:hypothetical protein Pmani_025437 [Petrolisthes manimaculis]
MLLFVLFPLFRTSEVFIKHPEQFDVFDGRKGVSVAEYDVRDICVAEGNLSSRTCVAEGNLSSRTCVAEGDLGRTCVAEGDVSDNNVVGSPGSPLTTPNQFIVRSSTGTTKVDILFAFRVCR